MVEQDADIPVDAVLEFLGGNKIKLTLTEHLDGFSGIPGITDRISVLEGKITPIGVIKMEFLRGANLIFPDGSEFYLDLTIVEIVQNNTGCSVNGQFPVWHGTYDGTSLIADSHFNSICPWIEGPAYWNWSLDLTVD